MPFTLAHPAAVLPLVRRPLIASALVAGALAPDLLYVDPVYRFATQQIHGDFTLTLTHEFSSALWLDPLIAMILLAVFHSVIRRPLTALAPSGLAARLPVPPPLSVTVLLWAAFSAVLGALTHVLWDSFTHGDGYFVRRFPDLFRAGVTATWDVNRVLQYVSTVGGCLILAAWLYRWYRRTAPVNRTDQVPPWVRYGVLAGTLALGVAGAAVQLGGAEELAGETAVRLVLTGLVFGGLAALGWYVVLWHLARWRRRDATDGAA
ncbi:DUF4184 family protein [Kribbella turkmenica]|uniref:DUF4184 family protein n=1 Tax=Kribbella turkmenica TaxID=2530375 RepID=A0A4V2YD47_9ACTN|nr:DUF4184 family protein [Kribbella turkmenica]TDD14016.1 DUF4184 family protein [Kribbella turkmenica]